MDKITECNGNFTLDTVRQQFESWRSESTKRKRIPPHLWEAAVRLCETYPITHVCRYLRLSFPDLKKHISTAKPPMIGSARFMEFDLSCISGGRWQIECDRPDGAKLKMSGNGQPPVIENVLREFIS
jgi:hypothetical protein